MKLWIDGSYHPTCIQVGIFLFGKPRFVRTVYPRNKKPQKSKILRIAKKHFPSYLRKAWQKVLAIFSVDKIQVQMDLGLEDAAATALGTGAIYSIWGLLNSLLQKYIPIRQAAITVRPVYQKIFFSAKINCIVKISLGKAIGVVFDFWKEARQNERTSYMRTYDHSYAKH